MVNGYNLTLLAYKNYIYVLQWISIATVKLIEVRI